MNENRAGIWVQFGLLIVGVSALYLTITNNQERTESRLTRIEVLISANRDAVQSQINNHEGRISRLEDRTLYRVIK